MRKSELINKIKEHIDKTAGQKNAQVTASAMYFIFKQYAISIEGGDVRGKVLDKVRQLRSQSLSLSTQISTIKTQIQGILAAYPSQFEQDDITSLVAVNVDLQSCATAADVLAAECISQFPSLDE